MGLPEFGSDADLADFVSTFSADTSQYRRELQSLIDDTTEGLEEVGDETEKTGQKFDILGGAVALALGGIAFKAITGLFDAVVGLGNKVANMAVNFVKDGIAMNAQLQILEISFISLTGSAENAAAVMDFLEEKAVALGQSPIELTTLGRRFLPFAKGDLDTLDQMLTLAQQLAVLNPVAGLEGAGRVLSDVLSGGAITNFQRVFDVNRQALQALREEFQRTGDMDAFVEGLQGLVAAAGVSAEDIEAFAESTTGGMARIQQQISKFQRTLAIPVGVVFNELISEIAGAFEENADGMEIVAVRVGAFIGAAIISVINFIKSTVRLVDLTITLIEVLTDAVLTNVSIAIATIAGIAIDGVNTVISAVNKLPGVDFGLVDFDKDAFTADVRSGLDTAVDIVKAAALPIQTAIKAGFEGGAIFPDFQDNVARLSQAAFDELNRGAENTLGEQEAVQIDLLDGWEEFYEELAEIFEEHDGKLEKERDRHLQKLTDLDTKFQQKMQDIARKFNQRRADAERDFADDIADARLDLQEKLDDIDRDLARKREDIIADRAQREVEIEQESASRILEIRNDLERSLFDAVNARDARRVFELLAASRQSRQEEKNNRQERLAELNKGIDERLRALDIERQRRRADAQRDFDREIADLQRNLQRRMADIQRQLQREIEAAQIGLQRQREAEQQAHERRMSDLATQLQERLTAVAAGWAEENRITEEALAAIGVKLEEMFGRDGLAATLLAGFNSAIKSGLQNVAQEVNTTFQRVDSAISRAQATARQASAQIETGIFARVNNQFSRAQASSGITGFIAPQQSSIFAGTNTDAGRAFAASQAAGGQLVFDPSDGVFKDPRLITAAEGFEGIVNRPTLFLAGEGSRPEMVSITPEGREGGGGAGGTFNIHVTADRNFSRDFEASLSEKISRFVGGAVSGRRRTRRG